MTQGGSKVLIVFKTTKRGYKDIGTVKIKNEKYQFDVLLRLLHQILCVP